MIFSDIARFPDALFIYLYRNPRENISSMMDAWESGRFVTYNSLPGRDTNWSLLLPPGWRDYINARALSRVLPKLNDTMDYIQKNVGDLPVDEFDLSIDPSLLEGMSINGMDGGIGAASGIENGN